MVLFIGPKMLCCYLGLSEKWDLIGVYLSFEGYFEVVKLIKKKYFLKSSEVSIFILTCLDLFK